MIPKEKWLKTKAKPHHITLGFLYCNGEKVFVNGKLIPAYYAVKNFFKTLSTEELNVLYEYLQTIEGTKKMDITTFINDAKTWNVSKHYKQGNEVEYTDYKSLLEEL